MSAPARYDVIGNGYAAARRPDARVEALIRAGLGDAGSVLNVGAGAGAYEPPDLSVVAVEPSPVMLAQRPAGAAPAVRGVAEALPFRDGRFDATTAIFTVHHWADPARGLAELRRVARRQVVLTWDPELTVRSFWFGRDYLPEAQERERGLPTVDAVVAGLGPGARVVAVPVPHDCTDGFFAAYWRRPQAYLDPAVRAGMSATALLEPAVVDAAVARLRADLADGTWQQRYGDLLAETELDVGYRLVVAG